jgi:hypothetical protein
MICKGNNKVNKYNVGSRNAATLDSLIISLLLARLELQAETTQLG